MLINLSNIYSLINSSDPVSSTIGIIIYAIIVAVILSIFGYTFGWIERKLIAKAQFRHGPTYVGKYGFLQNLADLIKLISKADIKLERGSNFLLRISIIALLAISIFLLFLLPYSPSLQATNFGLGLLIIFITIAFLPLIIFIAGFSTGNKFADISAQRSVLILVSYELPMLIVIATIAHLSNGYNIQSIINFQANGYLALLMPLGFFIVFVAMLAEFERPPFDLREADSELIAGWLTDVSPPYYALVLFLDYTRMFLGSLIITVLFLGGWLGPSFLPPLFWLLLKATIIAIFVIMIRATTFRMRIDRVLRLGWIVLIPLSLINLIITYMIFG